MDHCPVVAAAGVVAAVVATADLVLVVVVVVVDEMKGSCAVDQEVYWVPLVADAC